MTSKEATDLVIELGTPLFKNIGWKFQKRRGNEAFFWREDRYGYDRIAISQNNYFPVQCFRWGTGKRINAIEKIIRSVNKLKPIKKDFKFKPNSKENCSLYYTAIKRHSIYTEIPDVEFKEDIIPALKILINYVESRVNPRLRELSDIREIDKIVNGESYWDSDFNREFNLAHLFNERRLIIARLSGRKDYNIFLEKFLSDYEKRYKNHGMKFSRIDKEHPIIFLKTYLDEIEPIYQ